MSTSSDLLCEALSISGSGYLKLDMSEWKPATYPLAVELPVDEIAKLWTRYRTEYLFNDASSSARETDDSRPTPEDSSSAAKAETWTRGNRSALAIDDMKQTERDILLASRAIECSEFIMLYLRLHKGVGFDYEAAKYQFIKSQGPVLMSQMEHCDSFCGWSVEDQNPTLSVVLALNPHVIYVRAGSHRRPSRFPDNQMGLGDNGLTLNDVEFPSEPVKLNPGDLLIYRGDLVHSGAGWVARSLKMLPDGSLDQYAPDMYSLRLFFYLVPRGRVVGDQTHFMHVNFSY